MNILISGGAGFIGSALSVKLLEVGHSVRVVDDLLPQIHGVEPEKSYTYNLINGKTEFIRGNVTERNTWLKVIDGIDCIIHLASETGTGQSMYEIKRYVNANCVGTGAMLDVLANHEHRVERIILSSSRAVYGEGKHQCEDHGIVYPGQRKDTDMASGDFGCKCPQCGRTTRALPTDELSQIKPASVYAVTKYSQEQLLLTTSRALGIKPLIFRFQNVYGPGQSLKNPYTGVLSVFATLLRQNQNLNIFEDGNESRDFILIDDVVDSLLIGIHCKNPAMDIYNVGSGKSTSILETAELLKTLMNSESKLNISGNFRSGDIRTNFADISRIENDLDFKPKIDLKSGLSKFLKWTNSQENITIDYNGSLDELRRRDMLK